MPDVVRIPSPIARLTRMRASPAIGVALVVTQIVVVFLLGNLPTPLYGEYRDAITFTQLTLTLIYGAYVVGATFTMFFFGRLSDQIGRKPVVLAALALAGVACVVFLAMSSLTSVALLTIARVASGLAVALASGASTAWLIETKKDTASGTRLAIVANLVGLGAGPVVAGFIGSLYAPFALMLALLVVAALATSIAKETVVDKKPVSLKPRIGVPKEMRAQFASASIGGFATFAVLGFYSALAPSVLQRAIEVRSQAAAGVVVGVLFFAAAIAVAFTPKDIDPTRGMLLGLALLLPGIGLLALSEAMQSMTVLVVGTVLTGVACGVGYLCELRSVNEAAPEDRRAEVVSTFLIVCYAAVSLPVVGVALVSGAFGRSVGDYAFAAVVAALTIAAIVLEAIRRRSRAATPDAPGSDRR